MIVLSSMVMVLEGNLTPSTYRAFDRFSSEIGAMGDGENGARLCQKWD